jgi:hypothetical protein
MTHYDFDTLDRGIAFLEAELAKPPRVETILQRSAQTLDLIAKRETGRRWLAEIAAAASP